MRFIKFLQEDPGYKGSSEEVVVCTDHIVKIEPVYFEVNAQGKRFLAKRTPENTRKLGRSFRVHDALGNTYESASASQATQQFIEALWNAAL
jgi:hypothetical protein